MNTSFTQNTMAKFTVPAATPFITGGFSSSMEGIRGLCSTADLPTGMRRDLPSSCGVGSGCSLAVAGALKLCPHVLSDAKLLVQHPRAQQGAPVLLPTPSAATLKELLLPGQLCPAAEGEGEGFGSSVTLLERRSLSS